MPGQVLPPGTLSMSCQSTCLHKPARDQVPANHSLVGRINSILKKAAVYSKERFVLEGELWGGARYKQMFSKVS